MEKIKPASFIIFAEIYSPCFTGSQDGGKLNKQFNISGKIEYEPFGIKRTGNYQEGIDEQDAGTGHRSVSCGGIQNK
jgi:hypothetical protein